MIIRIELVLGIKQEENGEEKYLPFKVHSMVH